MIEVSGAISGITAIVQTLKTAVQARDEAKIDAAMSDLKDRLFDLQAANLQLLEQLHTSQTQVHTIVQERDQLKAQASERGKYVLDDVSKGRGTLYAYLYKGDDAVGNGAPLPLHYLCQPCFDSGRKSVLRIIYSGAGPIYQCTVCNTNTGLE